jgi:hypothetical protein
MARFEGFEDACLGPLIALRPSKLVNALDLYVRKDARNP